MQAEGGPGDWPPGGQAQRRALRGGRRPTKSEATQEMEAQHAAYRHAQALLHDPLGQVPFGMVKEGAADWIQCQGCHEWLPVHPEVISIYKDAQNVRFMCRFVTGSRCRSEPRHQARSQEAGTRARARRSSNLRALTCCDCSETHMVGPNAFQRWHLRQVVCGDLGLACEARRGA